MNCALRCCHAGYTNRALRPGGASGSERSATLGSARAGSLRIEATLPRPIRGGRSVNPALLLGFRARFTFLIEAPGFDQKRSCSRKTACCVAYRAPIGCSQMDLRDRVIWGVGAPGAIRG